MFEIHTNCIVASPQTNPKHFQKTLAFNVYVIPSCVSTERTPCLICIFDTVLEQQQCCSRILEPRLC